MDEVTEEVEEDDGTKEIVTYQTEVITLPDGTQKKVIKKVTQRVSTKEGEKPVTEDEPEEEEETTDEEEEEEEEEPAEEDLYDVENGKNKCSL